ncbi:hypothetical protein B9479_003554 [Cryptococcus floricola]|uniref:NAD(P)-binding domain-containing protein n=1 Tax=Cryptococcus floricola TaxID=2591691 RepID=A0A5D3B0U7_9TREE|nr:hypothetical protein B9479_003554 [Cryptococcus floricola]
MVNVFITGASGFVGSHVTPILLAAGHQITAIAKSDASAKKLEDQGVTVIRASLEDTDALAKAASESDGVIHLGFIHDFSNYDHSVKVDLAAIEAFGKALNGSNKPLITTSAIPVAGIRNPSELSHGTQPPRDKSEHLTTSLASSGVRSHVVRLPPTVHGDGDQAFLTHYAQQSKKAGFAGYIGDGETHWPAVHVKDAAEIYKLALESTTLKGGEILHAAQDAGVAFKDIAAAVSGRLGVETKSITAEQAGETYTWLSGFIASDTVAESQLTRKWLGWEPKEKGLVEDIKSSKWYFEPGTETKF